MYKGKYFRLDPLVKKMERVLEALLNFQREKALEMLLEELPGELPIENFDLLIGFLVDEYLKDLLEFRRIRVDRRITPEKEKILTEAIERKIEFLRERGVSLGYRLEVLWALARVITENTANLKEVEKWKEKLLALKEKLKEKTLQKLTI